MLGRAPGGAWIYGRNCRPKGELLSSGRDSVGVAAIWVIGQSEPSIMIQVKVAIGQAARGGAQALVLVAALCWSCTDRGATGEQGVGRKSVAGSPGQAGTSGEESILSKNSEDVSAERQMELDQEDAFDDLGGIGYLDFAEEDEAPRGREADGKSVGDQRVSGVSQLDAERSYPGYNLVVSIPHALAQLIDANGRVVRDWSDERCRRMFRAQLLGDGRLVYLGTATAENEQAGEEDAEERPLALDARLAFVGCMSWEGDVLWRRKIRAHHDVELTPQGEVLTLTERRNSIPAVDPENLLRDNGLCYLELETGKILREIGLTKILVSRPDMFQLQDPPKSQQKGKDAIDHLHCNSVETLDRHGLAATEFLGPEKVLLSIRHQDSIAIVNTETMELVWAWGQGELQHQHEATLNYNGKILLFDNGSQERNYSRILEVDPETDSITWEWTASNPHDFFSLTRGTVQPLPNGNVLVGSTNQSEAFEVTRAGEVVWKFVNPIQMSTTRRAVLRIERYPLEHVDRLLTADSEH